MNKSLIAGIDVNAVEISADKEIKFFTEDLKDALSFNVNASMILSNFSISSFWVLGI